MEKLLKVDKEEWKAEHADQEKFFKTFGDRFPKELWEEFKSLGKRLG